MARILLIGCGQVLSQLPALWPGHDYVGIRRSNIPVAGATMMQLDLLGAEERLLNAFRMIGPVDAVVFSATPDERTETSYRRTYCEVPQRIINIFSRMQTQPFWLHLSSTGVFQHHCGEWVHENTEPAPRSPIASLLRQSEQVIEAYGKASIVRFGGLYGQGRTHLLRSIKAGRHIQSYPNSYTNRIHRLDAVRVIQYLLQRALEDTHLAQVDYFHGVDHDPAPLHEVTAFLCGLYGLKMPGFYRLAGTEAIHSQNKRVGNRKLLELGFVFRYPTYRQGFAAEHAQ